MKKLLKIKTLVFILLLLIAACYFIPVVHVDAKDRYFAGYYKAKGGKTLKMNQYSSPEGKEKGNFHIQMNDGRFFCDGTLRRIGKNKYRYNAGNFKLTFIVYKKKVVVKQSKKIYSYAFGEYLTYAGTYKLKKRYYS